MIAQGDRQQGEKMARGGGGDGGDDRSTDQWEDETVQKIQMIYPKAICLVQDTTA